MGDEWGSTIHMDFILRTLNEFYPTGKVLTISVYFVAASDCFLINFRFFAPNKSATLLLGAMNNASIPAEMWL
jgi:diphthamide biosynthesis methyltransferase